MKNQKVDQLSLNIAICTMLPSQCFVIIKSHYLFKQTTLTCLPNCRKYYSNASFKDLNNADIVS